MTDVLLSIMVAALLFLEGLGYKYNELKNASAPKNEYVFNLFAFLLCLLQMVFFALASDAAPDAASLLFGIGQGILFCALLLLYNKSLKYGNIAFINFIMSLCMIIPIFVRAVFFDEAVSTFQYVGLALLLVAAYIVSAGQRTPKTAANTADPANVNAPAVTVTAAPPKNPRRWLKTVVLPLVAMTVSGSLSTYIYIVHKTAAAPINDAYYMLSSFVVASAVVFVLAAVTTHGFRGGVRQYFPNRHGIIAVLIVCAGAGIGNIAFTSLSPKISAAIFYPITAALPMLLAAAVSPLLREKLSKLSVLGILVGTCAIVLINF